MSGSLNPSGFLSEDLLQCAVCRSTLQDPVLLQCLHSSCGPCASDTSSVVSCLVCGVTSDTSKKEANLIVLALGHRSQLMKNIFSCTRCCLVSEQHEQSSVSWCYNCQQSLCTDCEKYHKATSNLSAHKLMKLDENTILSELYRPPTRACLQHGEEQKLVCFTCQDGRCFKCAHDCYKSSHDVELLDSAAALNRLNEKITDATRDLLELNSPDVSLQANLDFPEKVALAMEERRSALRKAKKTAIDSISKAYDQAENSLIECCDILVSKAQHLCQSAEGLQQRRDWTNRYCQLALKNKNDVAALLPQLDTMRSCLRSLLDQLRNLKTPADPMKLLNLNLGLPRDLDLITSDWFCQATIAKEVDFPADDVPDVMKSGYYVRKVSTLNELEQLLEKQKEQEEILARDRLALEQLEAKLKSKEPQLAPVFSCERCGYDVDNDEGGHDGGGYYEDDHNEHEYEEHGNDGGVDDEDVYDERDFDDGYDQDDYYGGDDDGADYNS